MLVHWMYCLLIIEATFCYLMDHADAASKFRKQAFKDAKRQNDIPIVQQPIRTTMIPDRGSYKGQMLRQYDFKNNKGEFISIRQDLPQKYPGGGNGKGDQGHHFNAGPSGEKLKQHYYFDKFNSKKQG